jgi:UDP-N-acetylglucosamine 2-epimerase (non-hydrolysing)
MSNINVVTIVGTRPEIIRLSRLIPKLDEYTNHVFVHTGDGAIDLFARLKGDECAA